MRLTWALLYALAAAVAGAALADTVNITSIVNDPNAVPANLDWDMGIILSTPYDYMGTDNFGAATAASWQQFYQQKAVFQAHELGGRGSAWPGNATLAIEVTGSIGRWGYRSNTSCATVITRPCNSFSSADLNLAGTGLVPITCGRQDPARPAAAGNVLCNAVYKRSAVQLFPAGLTDALHTLNGTGAAERTLELGHFMMPMSRGDLLLDMADQFEWVDLDSGSFDTVDPPVQYLARKRVKTSLSSFRGLSGAGQCAGSQLPLVLPLQGMLLGGAMYYCFEVQGDIVAMTWNISGWATITSCGRIVEKRRFMLVLYGGRQIETDQQPFDYIYTVEEAADGQWGVTCTTRCYQTANPVANENWDRLYSLLSDGLPAFWSLIGKCTNGTWVEPSNSEGLQYEVEIIKGLARGNGDDVLYPHFSPQSMGSLQGPALNASQLFKLTPSSGPDICVLKQVNPTPNVAGDGSATLATGSISSLLALGTASGCGSKNLPLITQQINEMSQGLSALTVAGAVNAAMTSIVAAYGANVFTLKIKFLKATDAMRLTIRALVSIVEAAVVSISAITAMWALYTSGRACRTVQWVDSQKGTSCDYESCNHYMATTATICGGAEYLVEQWVVLGVAMLLAVVLIMYRWHFASGGSVSDWVQVETDQENAAPHKDDKV